MEYCAPPEVVVRIICPVGIVCDCDATPVVAVKKTIIHILRGFSQAATREIWLGEISAV